MPTIGEVRLWAAEANAAAVRIGGRFARREQRVHAGRYLRGLIARDVPLALGFALLSVIIVPLTYCDS